MSFVSGYQAIDNIVIAQELFHSLQDNKSKKGGMVVKVDLENAYDYVE